MSTATESQKAVFPTPRPDADTQAYWDGVAREELLCQHCPDCERWIWQPSPVCPGCSRAELPWRKLAGAGRVASWMVVRPPTLPAYADLVPLVVMLVELDEGIRMIGYLVADDGALLQTDGEAEGVAIGRRVALRFHTQGATVLPSWTLRD